jgi:hypothetical protein
MDTSASFRQTALDRLEICSGGGCLSLFGIPFLAAGIFLLLVALQILRLSNADEVPLLAWPLLLLMGLAFAGVGGGWFLAAPGSYSTWAGTA